MCVCDCVCVSHINITYHEGQLQLLSDQQARASSLVFLAAAAAAPITARRSVAPDCQDSTVRV